MLFKLVFTKCGCAIKQQKLFTIATPYLFRRSYVSTLKTIVKTPLNKSPKFNIHKLTPIRTGSNLYTKFFFFRFCSTSAKSASKDATSKSSLRWLLQLAKPERTRLFVAVFLLIISSGITLIIPYGIGQVIDIIYTTSKEKVVNDLTRFCQFLLLIFVIGGLANFGRITIMQTSGNRIVKKLKDDLFSSLVKQDISFFDKSKTGGLINRLSADTAMVGHTLTMNISDGLRSTTQAIGGISWMVYTSPQLAGVSLLAVIPLTLFTRGYGRFVKKISSDVQDFSAEASEVAEESLSSIRTVQSFVKEEKEMGDYRRKIEYVLSLSFKESLAKGVFWSMTGFSGNLIIVLVFYYGGLMVSKGQITVGELSSFLVYAAFVGVSFGGMTSFYTELMRGIGAGNRVFELLDRKPTISALGGLIPQAPPTGHISYHNVAFTYPERPDSPILTNFNLNLPAGSVTALVGPSGSGKSTVANLLLRFYDPLEGKVYLDETPVSDYNLHWLRDNISIVSQDPVLFSCSIADNIAYGAKEHSKVATSNIIQSAIKANAHQFIEKFPKGYETSVGEKGVMLSGGQKQRIAIARAIIKNPRILLLDEATSALDAESEHLVQEALVRVMEGRTVLVIAHRLSTIRRADQIAVLQGGKVIEMGAYEELMKLQGGEFRKLVERQTMGMVEG